VVHTQTPDAHKHREGIEQKEDKQPGERRAEPVAHGGVEEEQIRDRMPYEDRHEVFVVVPAYGVVDERTGEEWKNEVRYKTKITRNQQPVRKDLFKQTMKMTRKQMMMGSVRIFA